MVQPSYEYLPLQHDDSFRIIILHPSPNESDPIACTILRERLSDESVKYEAVSYTWGDNTETNKINLNGDTEQIVGKNCHAALRRLRRSDEDRSIWIDAICINQNDLNERSRQVRLMNEIYTLAAGVMVMLSDQVPDCRLLLREVATPKTAGSPQPTRTVLKQLEELFEDPWFKRTWVLQEVYEKKKITVMQSEIDYLIDYTQSLEELFEHVAEFLLPVLGIRILAATRHPHKLDMPSWMPDWSKTLPLQSLVFQFESEKARMLRTSSVYATADDRDLTLQSYSHGDCSVGPELHLAGCRYAQLVKSSQVFHFLDTDDADRQMLKVYNDFVNRKSYLDATGQRKLIPSSTLSHFGRKIFHGKRRRHIKDARN
ncbi:hypothetical protein J4E91_010450 [Alternaria rosae]|nr:hypothetical protein J4E91_010450 [Alternaria rosae]